MHFKDNLYICAYYRPYSMTRKTYVHHLLVYDLWERDGEKGVKVVRGGCTRLDSKLDIYWELITLRLSWL